MLRPRTAVRWVSYRRRGSFADRKSRPESPKRLLANTSHCGDPRSVKLINGWEEALSFWLHLCGFGGACGATVNPHNNKEAATMVQPPQGYSIVLSFVVAKPLAPSYCNSV
jgi:hypothetical protein